MQQLCSEGVHPGIRHTKQWQTKSKIPPVLIMLLPLTEMWYFIKAEETASMLYVPLAFFMQTVERIPA